MLPLVTDDEDELWVDDVINTIHRQPNEMHPNQIHANLIRRIEQRNSTEKQQEFTNLIRAQWMDNKDFVENIGATYTPLPATLYQEPHTAYEDMKDLDDDKVDWNFEGKEWTLHDGDWIPPDIEVYNDFEDDEPEIEVSPSINKIATTDGQSDSGANNIVTDDRSLLSNFQYITPLPMGGCNKDDPAAIICTGIGIMTFTCNTNGTCIKVQAYYSDQVDGTIISPTALVRQHRQKYIGFLQYSDCDNNNGVIKLISRNNCPDFEIPIYSRNDLWYHRIESFCQPCTTTDDQTKIEANSNDPSVRRISTAATYELWHQRSGHIGHKALTEWHKHATGVPQLKGNAFYKCPSCMSGKLCIRQPIGKQTKKQKETDSKFWDATKIENLLNYEDDDDYLPDAEPGQHFSMDYGFVRGSQFKSKDEDGHVVTSFDGKNSYLIIVDRGTRYTWTFLSNNKVPPVDAARQLLKKFKSSNPHRTVRVDQGGELGKSQLFKNMLGEDDIGFTLEITGSDSSSQNGLAERPNRTYADMMRCILHSSELGPQYWSYALLYAVHIKNRILHTALQSTPYQVMTGKKPDVSHLRIFGSNLYAREPGRRKAKLDHHTSIGTFLGFAATNANIIYIDNKTAQVKTAHHVIFDEAQMTLPQKNTSVAAQTLQRLGYYLKENISDIEKATIDKTSSLKVKLLNNNATLPKRSTELSIGYDLCSAATEDIVIPAKSMKPISTGLAIKCPQGTYARIAPRSGLTVKNNLTTMAGVIDPDYRGEIIVLIHNFGDKEQIIKPKQRTAQLILERAEIPAVELVDELDETSRGIDGFGSTETKETTPNIPTVNTINTDIDITFDTPYEINFSSDPTDFHTFRNVTIRENDDNLLGMEIEMCQHRDRPKLIRCKKGHSAARIIRWRSELREGYITAVNNSPVKSIAEIEYHIQQARQNKHKTIKINFATIKRQAMHPQLGTPQMYHDQMNVVAEHLWEIRNSPEWQKRADEAIVYAPQATTHNKLLRLLNDPEWHHIRGLHVRFKIAALKKRKKLTRRYLKEQPDWSDWLASEAKQLNQYESQGTFGKPQELPKGANLLPLLWTYMIKDCGTKKARCVCNGSPKQRGSVTLANTYAGSLEQVGARIFWAATAIHNFITIGADASNAFAEAPAPKAPLFVTIDQPFREWYRTKYPDRPDIPYRHVLPVHGALQGHPESARLWAKLIDKVIRHLNLQPCTHEPCLYFTRNYNNTGKTVLFLRQVDDFAIACQDRDLAKQVIHDINSKMTIDVKELGQIHRYNGVDVEQTRDYVKIYNPTYIDKILLRHDWIKNEKPLSLHPIPIKSDAPYQRQLETAPHSDEQEIKKLEKEYGFGYRQAIGEMIYALVTCRPDISYAVTKLSQYSTRPARIHFEACKHVYKYLHATKNEGIYYWRQKPREDLPITSWPTPRRDENYSPKGPETVQNKDNILVGAVDADYAGDIEHRKSVSGVILKLAGGAVLYKTKYQDTIAHSSTEAEFAAAAEAGKFILYVRSILDEVGIPQDLATTLYEDNQGALLMANAQQPTKRTRHMNIKSFALQEWVEQDLILLRKIHTGDNYSDAMTKATARTLFYRHMDHIMGKITPEYVSTYPHRVIST